MDNPKSRYIRAKTQCKNHRPRQGGIKKKKMKVKKQTEKNLEEQIMGEQE